MPDVVNTYLETHNVVKVRELQNSIKGLYADDASKYESNNGKNLLIKRIYDMIPSQMENKKKSIVFKDVRNKDNVKSALVLSNEREVKQNGKIVYLPIYYVMFIDVQDNEELLEF